MFESVEVFKNTAAAVLLAGCQAQVTVEQEAAGGKEVRKEAAGVWVRTSLITIAEEGKT